MKSFFREILGGVGIMLVATLVGITVNAMRSGGIPLIQQGTPISTVQHEAAADTTKVATVADGAISLADLKALFDANTAFIIDARDPVEYDEGHIPGSVNVPYDRLPEYLDILSAEVPMDGDVIVYCRGPNCDFSDHLSTELKILGYQHVRVFSGGWEQWSAAGYPVEGMAPK